METDLPALGRDDDRIHFLGSFASIGLEEAFRARYRDDDLWIARVCIIVAMVRILVCTILDYRALPASVFLCCLAGRAVVVLLSLWVLVNLRSADQLFFRWCLLLVGATICFASIRLPIDASHAYLTVATVLGAYAFVPLPLAHLMVGAIPFSIAVVALLLRTSICAGLTLAGAFVLAHVFGVVISTQLNRWRRQGFLLSQRETQLRCELQQALAEVKTLRGHIPICAWCKSIRDEDNAWQPVESYVGQHTYAEFSHGMCPVCARAEMARLTSPS
jgi:hypothetical protein